MKLRRLEPDSEKLAREALRDIDAAMAGKPSSYRRMTYAETATPEQAKKARKLSGLPQPEFALAIGASPATVRSWEQGQRTPDGVSSKMLRLLTKRPGLIKDLLKDTVGLGKARMTKGVR